jgi:DNA-binding NarL/FixJ family response regulator
VGIPVLVLAVYEGLRLLLPFGASWPLLGPLAVVAFFILVTIELFRPLAKEGESVPAAQQQNHANGFGGSAEAEERARRIAARCAADPLTKRELEVLGLLLEGWRNQDIAERLGLSQSTVKNHVYNLYQKTGVANRVELSSLGE